MHADGLDGRGRRAAFVVRALERSHYVGAESMKQYQAGQLPSGGSAHCIEVNIVVVVDRQPWANGDSFPSADHGHEKWSLHFESAQVGPVHPPKALAILLQFEELTHNPKIRCEYREHS